MLAKLSTVTDGDKTSLKSCLDEIMNENRLDDHSYIREIIETLTSIKVNLMGILDHPFFVHLRKLFLVGMKTSTNNDDFAFRISRLFCYAINEIEEKHLPLAMQLFTDSTLVECLIMSLQNLSFTSNAHFIGSIDHMIDVYRKIQEDRPSIQDDPILSTLIMPIVGFIRSTEYRQSFLQLSVKDESPLTPYQQLILITCPKYVTSYRGQLQEEIVTAMAQEVLIRSSGILEHFLHSIEHWNESSIYALSLLILLCQRCANQYLLRAYDQQHEKILHLILPIIQEKHFWSLLHSNSTVNQHQKRVYQLFCYTTLYIYTMTFLPAFRDQLKERQITPVLIQLTQITHEKTQFHAYRALAALLTDQDIKQLAHPDQIITVFLTYMKKSIDSVGLRQRLENLLLSLKILTQYEQIKQELVKQNDGLSLLLRCAMESQFDATKIQLRALKILMSLTFHNDVKISLQNNQAFIQHLHTLTTSSKTADFQNIADAILWRLNPKDQITSSKYQYDMMISYAHKDKDICHRIHKALVANNYRVWIDLERMNGIIMQAIADAIEQSRYVVICMSDSYSVSPYCQSEVQYAFEKRRILVPIRVQAGYKPQGWLALTLSGRMYIDFIKLDFETAYGQLRAQFHQDQPNGTRSSTTKTVEKAKEKKESVVYSYPKDILQWNTANVHDFLLDKQLDPLVPICQDMDGQRLLSLYQLCSTNSPLMLQTLRAETMDLHMKPLSTNIYLRFLHEVKQVKPADQYQSSSTTNSHICILL